MKKIRKGDVIVIKNHSYRNGEIGLVRSVDSWVPCPVNVQWDADNTTYLQGYPESELEVIDHIEEDLCVVCGVELNGVGVTSNGERICNKCNDENDANFERCGSEPRVGDVVVIREGFGGLEDRAGWIGLIEGLSEYTEQPNRWQIRISEGIPQAFIVEYPTEAIEVIDHIEQMVMCIYTDQCSVTSCEHKTPHKPNAYCNTDLNEKRENINITHFNGCLGGPGKCEIVDSDKPIITKVLPGLVRDEFTSKQSPATNRYGVDVAYFKKELAALSQSLDNRTPEELHRYLVKLSEVAYYPLVGQRKDELDTECKQIGRYEENGWEYWLEQVKEKLSLGNCYDLVLIKQCKTCKSLRMQNIRTLEEKGVL